jgi:nucleoside 2-deoxyribosyltransferase
MKKKKKKKKTNEIKKFYLERDVFKPSKVTKKKKKKQLLIRKMISDLFQKSKT